MSKEKKVSQRTFREFLEKAKKESHDLPVIESTKREILQTMRKEGFTDEQIYEMKMERLWKLWIDSYSLLADQYLTQINAILEKDPTKAHIVAPYLQNLQKYLEESIRELEEEEKRKEKSD
jgi:membrane carboxypeptidase/penicillin-binding protein PbpC